MGSGARGVVANAIWQVRTALAEVPPEAAAERALRRRAEVLMAQVADVPVAVLIANDRARYVDVNEYATLLTGYSRQELLKMSVWDLTPRPRRAEGERMWRRFLRDERMFGLYPLCRKSGPEIDATFFALANVLPGLHVSALATPELLRQIRARRRGRRAAAPQSTAR